MVDNSYTSKLQEYNRINNSFDKTLIFHVGVSAGFHSEVDAMMQCMLYCYCEKIKFVLYADDANFAGGHGWSEFFVPFCEQTHDPLNKIANPRYEVKPHRLDKRFLSVLLKYKLKADYLTADIFKKCIPRSYSTQFRVDWPLFNINGTPLNEFAKLRDIALHYNSRTKAEVTELIQSIRLPENYTSIQFRGGDKILEYGELMDTAKIINKIEHYKLEIDNLFIFTDDYKYVQEVKKLRPDWTVLTLTGENEKGYNNEEFNKLTWPQKRTHMIKLFAMIDICISSKLHLGCEQTCVNNYIKSVKNGKGYIPIMDRATLRV
ncbi:MAG: hypothetical protein K2K70_03385 [Lachnospiraceae bacterium]|nr:hypothetical protein [Lachnospiraceae bacterium]